MNNGTEELLKLWNGMKSVISQGGTLSPRTARLLQEGVSKQSKKLVEEAVEVALEAVQGNHRTVIHETVDLIYNLVVLLFSMGIPLEKVFDEMADRRVVLGLAEKLPKPTKFKRKPRIPKVKKKALGEKKIKPVKLKVPKKKIKVRKPKPELPKTLEN